MLQYELRYVDSVGVEQSNVDEPRKRSMELGDEVGVFWCIIANAVA
jgi:hypothetical protein